MTNNTGNNFNYADADFWLNLGITPVIASNIEDVTQALDIAISEINSEKPSTDGITADEKSDITKQ
jgi:hypothetical protein